MPTILKKDGFAFRLYLDDHTPAHVHVFKAEGQAIIRIGDNGEIPSVREVYDMNNKTLKKALKIAAENQEYLRQEWEEYHG
ncbi:MAG: DUF4160 domain-containing protein [Cyanobacteria bacterium J06588_5]